MTAIGGEPAGAPGHGSAVALPRRRPPGHRRLLAALGVVVLAFAGLLTLLVIGVEIGPGGLTTGFVFAISRSRSTSPSPCSSTASSPSRRACSPGPSSGGRPVRR